MRGTTPSTVRPYGRPKLLGAGLVLALVGFLRMAKGVQVVTHWTAHTLPKGGPVVDCLAANKRTVVGPFYSFTVCGAIRDSVEQTI